jgi:hypothetical protein
MCDARLAWPTEWRLNVSSHGYALFTDCVRSVETTVDARLSKVKLQPVQGKRDGLGGIGRRLLVRARRAVGGERVGQVTRRRGEVTVAAMAARVEDTHVVVLSRRG